MAGHATEVASAFVDRPMMSSDWSPSRSRPVGARAGAGMSRFYPAVPTPLSSCWTADAFHQRLPVQHPGIRLVVAIPAERDATGHGEDHQISRTRV